MASTKIKFYISSEGLEKARKVIAETTPVIKTLTKAVEDAENAIRAFNEAVAKLDIKAE